MTGMSTSTLKPYPNPTQADTSPPQWVVSWLGDGATDQPGTVDNGEHRSIITISDDATLQSLTIANARDLSARDLASATADLYRDLLRRAAESEHRHVVRIWNHLPGIHDPLGEECDRYRVFNTGRFDALTGAFGSREALAKFAPAATGVGHDGRDLVVHALSTAVPGQPVENPAQVPAYRYSQRYGRLPPCFARATVVRGPRPTILVAGTAAISGEESQHADSLTEQLTLTLANLRHLIQAADPTVEQVGDDELQRFRHLRIYQPDSSDAARIRPQVEAVFVNAEINYLKADLCRSELLVEIEGIADFTG